MEGKGKGKEREGKGNGRERKGKRKIFNCLITLHSTCKDLGLF